MLAVAAAWALWLLAAQALLWTPLLRSLINAHSPRIHLEYASAWSVWPGTVHVRGMVLTGQDRSVEWRLALDEAKTSIAIGQLSSRIFHATRVRTRGVRFALRRRVLLPDAHADPERVRGLPAIEGLEPLPMKEEGPDDDLPDWRYRLFSVWLEDIEGADVRQIWIDRWRVEAKGKLAGAFYLKPLREVLVAPGVLRLDQASVSEATIPVADAVRGSLRVSLGAFNPRKLTMERFFRTVDVDADLQGRLAGIAFLGGTGGAGPAQVQARVRRGRVEHAVLSAQPGALAFHGLEAEGAALRATVQDGARADVEVSAPRAPRASLRAASVQLRLGGDAPDFGALKPPAFAALDVRGGRIDDARVLGRRLLHSRRVEAGRGSFTAHLEGPPSRLRGQARIALRRLRIGARGVKVRGDADVRARIANLDPRRGADLSGTRLSIDRGRLAGSDEEIAPGWWGRAVLRRARIRFDTLRLDADLAARCRDARPIVGLYSHLADLPGIVKGLFTMEGLSVNGSAHAGRGWISLPELVAEGNGASVKATLRQDAGSQRGAALLTVNGFSVALDLDGGGSSLHLFGPGDFFAERQREVRAIPLARRPTRPRR